MMGPACGGPTGNRSRQVDPLCKCLLGILTNKISEAVGDFQGCQSDGPQGTVSAGKSLVATSDKKQTPTMFNSEALGLKIWALET